VPQAVVFATGLQVPALPARLQESQVPPVHAVLQHTPSAQLPLVHWVPSEHVPPRLFLGTHAPALQ
jgi:hypothetical protein